MLAAINAAIFATFNTKKPWEGIGKQRLEEDAPLHRKGKNDRNKGGEGMDSPTKYVVNEDLTRAPQTSSTKNLFSACYTFHLHNLVYYYS